MRWLYFALGFLAFPTLGVALLLLVRLRSQARPVSITSPQELQSQLRALLESGKHGDTLFVVWLPLGFQLRVYKRVRRTEPDTLWLEVRNSDMNSDHYEATRAALESGRVEFNESLTPVRRRPRRLRITWPSGGPLVVSAASHAISLLESALPSDGSAQRLASRHHPSLWRRRYAAAV
jgi:hypothetical protein